MATGRPSGSQIHRLDYSIEYEGKKPEQEILDNIRSINVEQLASYNGSDDSLHGKIFYGDNLKIMSGLLSDGYAGKVKLIYIDPPFGKMVTFSSRKQQEAYEDILFGADYIEFLRERLIMMRELLATTGSIYLHLDETMAFQMKLVMDEVFGPENFHNWITRKKSNPKNTASRKFGNISDYIMFYSKSSKYSFNKQYDPWDPEDAKKEYRYVDSQGRHFKKVPIHAPGIRNGETGKPWKGKLPPRGKHWQYTPQKLTELDRAGDIFWSKTGNPRKKVYLSENKGILAQDIWLGYKDAHNQNIKITGYPTEKNEELLKRIIKASSNEGDLVLDAFMGSGTTLAAADKLKRNWIGIDNQKLAIDTTVNRLLHGKKRMGVFTNKNDVGSQEELDLGDVCNDASFNVYEAPDSH